MSNELKGLRVLDKAFSNLSVLKSRLKDGEYLDALIQIEELENSYNITLEQILKEVRTRLTICPMDWVKVMSTT
ncbi:MAG: hypothetical protein ABEK10_03550 [Candidatus Nanosalina sp.]